MILDYEKAKDEILNRIDIIELISEYVTLKKTGVNYKGLCPFHPEKTPSFQVNKNKQFFYCFGCRTGGDAITFLMKIEGLNFQEALEHLAKRCGITLRKGKEEGTEGKKSEKEILFQINKEAQGYFEKNLWKGGNGFDYIKSRGLSETTIKEFGLGYALNSWEDLFISFSKSHSAQLILKAGLICARQNGTGYYDRFRHRVIFPIENIYGEVCGFGGRKMSASDEGPKYLNSPETSVYTKGSILFGLNKAKNAINQAKTALIVEGYLDLITAFQAGFTNIVATLGTALTINHVRILKRYANTVILVFDPDAAGQNAAQRGIDILLEQGLNVKVALLPQGKDPDSFIKEGGQEKFDKIIEDAYQCIDFLLLTYELTGRLSIQEKAQRVEKLLPFLMKIRDPIEREGCLHYIAQKAAISEDALRERVRQVAHSNKKAAHSFKPQHSYGVENKELTEKFLIQLAFSVGAPSKAILTGVDETNFKDPDLRSLAEKIFEQWRQGHPVELQNFLKEATNERQKGIISEFLVCQEQFENQNQAINDCIKKLRQERIAEQLKTIKGKLDSDPLSKEEEDTLLGEYHRLKMECICH